MGSFSDDFPLLPAGGYQPRSVQCLIEYLGLRDVGAPERDAAISAWLESHPPGRLMAYTLRRHGLGHLIQ